MTPCSPNLAADARLGVGALHRLELHQRTPLILLIDGQPASVGNGMMVSLAASSRAQVDAVYARAMALGAKDEGPAGPRGDNFYAGYFRDLNGSKSLPRIDRASDLHTAP
jgi:uncharacterized glyoxalase superfamily protein PhnB